MANNGRIKSFYDSEVALIQHKLLWKNYEDGGLDGMTQYVEGVLDMTQEILDAIRNGEGY